MENDELVLIYAMSKGKKRKQEKLIPYIFLFIMGALIAAYPAISDFWNQIRTESIVKEYKGEVEKLQSQDLEKELQRALLYNNDHKYNTVIDVFSRDSSIEREYMTLLNPKGDGVMGYIEIPRIRQRIVIYHGTSEGLLQKGCGHIAGTSLPVGGKDSHAVLAAHRGLPRAKLFTDLDVLKEGDEFYLFILDSTFAYRVDQIKVVEPECFEDLQIIEGMDYVTLVTCTPYSVNTHRLLVRGHRVPYTAADTGMETVTDAIRNNYLVLVLIIVCLAIIIIFYTRRKNKRKEAFL